MFNWQPDRLIKRVFDDSATQNLVRTEILGHPDWLELDRGTLDFQDAVVRGAQRTGLPNADIARLLDEVPRSLTPIHETIELIRSMLDTEHRFYVLSNMHFASIAYLEKEHDIWKMFHGAVISCRIKKIKPEIEIYEYLLDKYQLDAAETIFIDDMSENLATARAMGIQTIQFINSAQCKQDLIALKCI